MRLLSNKSLIGISLLLGWVSLLTVAAAADQDSESKQDSDARKPIVLKNAKIYSMGPDGTFDGSIVITDGKISAIGAEGSDIETPEDATVYDLSGYSVTPGLIDSRSKLWLTDAARAEGNSRCDLNIVDAIDPWSEDWQELASQGITSVYAQPASGGLIGGYGAVLRVGPYTSVDEIVLREQVAVQAAVGVRGTTSNSRSRHTLVGQLERLLEREKTAMEKDEKKKKEEKEKEDKKKAAKKKTGKSSAKKTSGKKDAKDKDLSLIHI